MNKKFSLPNILLWMVAVAVPTLCVVAGMGLHRLFPTFDSLPLFLIFAGTMVILCIVNRLSASAFAGRHFGMSAQEYNALAEEHRAACNRDPDAVIRKIGNIAVLPVTLLVVYYILVVGMTVSMGMAIMTSGARAALVLLPLYLFVLPLKNQLDALRKGHLYKDELVPAGELPHLHELCRRAAREVGIKGTVRLQTVAENSCEISRFGRVYVVFLGSRALATLTEEELYAVLVRRFAFMPTVAEENHLRRCYRLSELGSVKPRRGTSVFDIFFSVADAQLEWYGPLYNTALSRRAARRASKFITDRELVRAYLNGVAKSTMWEYFDFEWYTYLPEPFYAAEIPHACYERTVCEAFRRAMTVRMTAWCDMIPERLSPAHYLGVTYTDERALLEAERLPVLDRLVFPDPQSVYAKECDMAVASVCSPIPAEVYAAGRKEHYLDKLAVILAWETSDKNRPTSEMSPVINAYRFLGRFADMEALCDRIIETEENPYAQAHAIYEKGVCLLWRYDTTGIDYIYRAMDLNKNYMKDGLEFVEGYCRLCGLANELETCHRRAQNLMEAHEANHEGACSLSSGDEVIRETALDDELTDILAYMEKVSEGCIDRIYLVRKVISEDFFTSAFVLDFVPGADEDTMRRAYEAIFHYLDGYPTDWQFSLFVYNRETEQVVRRVEGSLVWERGKGTDN